MRSTCRIDRLKMDAFFVAAGHWKERMYQGAVLCRRRLGWISHTIASEGRLQAQQTRPLERALRMEYLACIPARVPCFHPAGNTSNNNTLGHRRRPHSSAFICSGHTLGTIPSALGSLRHLRYLSLRFNNLTGKGVFRCTWIWPSHVRRMAGCTINRCCSVVSIDLVFDFSSFVFCRDQVTFSAILRTAGRQNNLTKNSVPQECCRCIFERCRLA